MKTDYGTIVVFLQEGLSYDQRISIIKTNVENQLLTHNRSHYIEILNQCIEISKLAETSAPFSINWNLSEYKYTFRIEMVTNALP